MSVEQLESSLRQAAEWFTTARHAVALTGAGISVPSGIPDFRTPESGLWAQSDPMEVASLTAFRRRPEVFYNWLRPLAQKSLQAKPNPAHLGLARLEKTGRLKTVITQNIDGLHQAAGSVNVIEVHGSMRTFTCPHCRQHYPEERFRAVFLDDSSLPRCPNCQEIVKPDIVLYEEMLDTDTLMHAIMECEQADLLLVVGSSLEVMPVGGLPYYSLKNRARFIINTLAPTRMDDRANIILRCDVVQAIPRLAELLA